VRAGVRVPGWAYLFLKEYEMCGIMGFVKTGKSTSYTNRVLTELMQGIADRGRDASGFATLSGKYVTIVKDDVDSIEMTFTKEWNNGLDKDPEILIGHARLATHGSVMDNVNNHPHYTKDLRFVLIHNGVIINRPYDVKTEGDCDSEILLRIVEKYGVKNGYIGVEKKVFGSYAVLLIDSENKKLYAFRNEKSPCCFIDLTEEIGGIVFASTKEIMANALRRAGLMISEERILGTRSYVLYEFESGNQEIQKYRRKSRRGLVDDYIG
jgi:glucosamine 6-phosphate synthetase-like amidotransferase/phosphosugar isomerase protein